MTVIPSGLSIAASNPTTAPPRSNAALGQQDFLTLLTTQLRNQDPLKPMENGEFLGQMAQFSTVSGIDRVNETLGSLGAGMRDMRIAMVSNLLGHSVLVPGTVTRPDSDGAIRGAIDLPEAVDAVQITWTDARSGAILHSSALGAQRPGLVGFEWTDVPPELVAGRTPVRVSVSAVRGTDTEPLDPMVYARVLSGRAGAATDDVTLQVEDFGALNALEIQGFR
jgi:flagellar basal-body rod modification protein FlgD